MQIICKNKNERKIGQRTITVVLDGCVKRIGRYLKRKYIRKHRDREGKF